MLARNLQANQYSTLNVDLLLFQRSQQSMCLLRLSTLHSIYLLGCFVATVYLAAFMMHKEVLPLASL